MAENIKLVTWTAETVTPLDDALIYDNAIGNSGFFVGCEVTLQSRNVLHIAAGHGIVCGRKFTVTASDISIGLTTGGTLNGRLYLHLDLANASEPVQLMTETAASLTPVVQEENVNINNGVFEFNIALFEVNESTIFNLQSVAPKVSGNAVLAMIAPEEVSPAGEAHTVGEYIVYNGTLYVVTSAIASGDDLVPGSNIMVTTVESMVKSVSGFAPNPMKAFTVTGGDMLARLYMTPPDDTVVDGQYLCYVGGFKVIYKAGSMPENINDGTELLDLSGDNMHLYETTPYEHTGLTNGTTYYYRAFPYSIQGTINSGLTGNTGSATPQPYVLYGFHYSENDSNPDSVTYPADCDNAGFTPFTMNLTTGVPNYGSWSPENEDTRWLFPRSCMVKYDGTVDYYLDEDDETKKENGTASDVANSGYAGNAMMEWGRDGRKIWWKVVPDDDGKGFTFYVANAQVDEDFHAWNHMDCNGNLADHFYTAKYFGSHDGTRIRSISGAANYVNTAGTNEIAKAKANNQGTDELWNIENWCDRFLIWMLLCMMGKSMNTQAVFGQGRCASGNNSAVANNTLNGKGMFCGYSNQTSDVKVFGMQGWWGNLWRRCNGLINDKGTVKVKLTYTQADGSTVDGYNTDGSGYIVHGTMAGGTSGGSISHMNISDKGLTPNTMSGGDQTYYCDGGWFNNSQINFALVGGNWNHAAQVGAGCVDLYAAVSFANSSLGAALSCKPLAS